MDVMGADVSLIWIFPEGIEERNIEEVFRAGFRNGWELYDHGWIEAEDEDDFFEKISEMGYYPLLKKDGLLFSIDKNIFGEMDFPHLVVLVETIHLEPNSRNYEDNIQSMMEISEVVSENVDSPYMFSGFNNVVPTLGKDFPGEGQLEKGEVPSIHKFNMLSDELVEKIGREKVLNSPALEIREFDGGVILRSSDYYIVEGREDKKDEVAEYLGIGRKSFLDKVSHVLKDIL